ncbi:MAG: Eco57I restriction-modification methylase domain-containing protein [Balneolales bacterium]
MNDLNLSEQTETTGEPAVLTPRKALNKAWLKVKPERKGIEKFKSNLIRLIDQSEKDEFEEYHKNNLSSFLQNTWYSPDYYINVKERNDLVIHNGKKPLSSVGVIIETKKPGNRGEMARKDNLNTKAMQELLLYYLRQRVSEKNLEIKHLIATNIYEWFIFEASVFEKVFAGNKDLVRQYEDFVNGRLSGTTTDFFYSQIASPAIEAAKEKIPFTHFDIRDYEKPLRNDNRRDDHKLIALFKLLSPEHLLKLPFANDSNTLDRGFYSELLHIIGLTEIRQKGKKLIERKKDGERDGGSLLENTIVQLDALDKIARLNNPRQYGETRAERQFNVALELVITWVNRILFLKLLEAQQINYHSGDKGWAFLNRDKIQNFDDLNSLFFSVLARRPGERNDFVKAAFAKVPYLNSSLFEPTDLEHDAILISNLRDERMLPILSTTVLKEQNGKRRTGELTSLEYLFEFLNAYDFSSEGSEEIQEDNKQLINASVLGLIFEKINGYKDGSFFTPGFITMYMCRETIRRAVVEKFNELTKIESLSSLDDIYNAIGTQISIAEANDAINSLKICDPAVGSGHFLVSALNEIITIKSDLGILTDREGRRRLRVHVEVVNDELIVTDEEGALFEYKPNSLESLRVQEALFHEKQAIIENCLFGVDINPNSVKICRLRLWIELLKNAYYRRDTGELETLPNIDINIKCGNSLISRFSLDSDLKEALKKSKWNIESYRMAVQTYREAHNKEQKREMKQLITDIKSDFRTEIAANDPKVKKLNKLSGELYNLLNQKQMFELSKTEQKVRKKKQDKLEKDINKLTTEIEEIKSNQIYENAFEWRFEFPEVLGDEGEFLGFDVVIGNPPYIRQEEIKDHKPYLKIFYKTYTGTADLYVFFVEKGLDILKKKGHFCFIMPNKWMQTEYGKKLRASLTEVQLQAIVNFGDLQVFDEATTYPCIINISKEAPSAKFITISVKTLSFSDGFNDYIKNNSNLLINELSSEPWQISSSADNAILNKINKNCLPLVDYLRGEAHYGIKTGLTEAFLVDENRKKEIISADPKSENLLKAVLRGRTIKKWYSESDKLWLIGTFPALNLNINNYPAISDHLKAFGKTRLEQSGKKGSRKKTSYDWFETQDSIVYWKEFEKPKIMYQRFQVKPCFIYDTKGLYCNDSMWIISKDDKVLVAILNSRIGWWLISKYCSAIQNGYQLIWKYFSQIPIPNAHEEEAKQIGSLVDQILESKKRDIEVDVSTLEKKIDQRVYKLYGLSREEIAIVERIN